jgi:hypothetical protein
VSGFIYLVHLLVIPQALDHARIFTVAFPTRSNIRKFLEASLQEPFGYLIPTMLQITMMSTELIPDVS